MEFTESLTLELPRIEASIAEAATSKKKGLVIELAAIHEGMTANFNHYSAEELTKACESWTTPYPKPIIRNHDVYTEPVGRVMDARMDKEADEDESPFIRLQVAITDAEAIEKVGDERYLTGSVGGKAGKALCSVCGEDWANSNMFEMPCNHKRGKTYKGKLAYFEMKDIEFKEYSFVNVPADQRSSIRSIASDKGTVTDSEEKVNDRPVQAHVYAMDMDNEKVVELSESGERNIFAEMKKREATPLYHVLRGAFLTTLALAEAEAEETISMPTEDDDDILEVMESLEETVTEEEDDAPEEEAGEEAAPEDEDNADAAEDESDAADEDAPEDEAAAEEDADDTDEADKPEGQEKPHAPEQDQPLPIDREGEEDGPEDEDPEDAPEDPAEDPEEDATEPVDSEPEESDERISALEAEVSRLSEENAKLKGYFKTQLAERVVDTKIALGLEEADARAALVEDHKSRTASSLRDSIRDLAALTPVAKDVSSAPTVESSVSAVGDDDGRSITTDVKDDNPTKTPQEQLIDGFVDVLMDRRRIN